MSAAKILINGSSNVGKTTLLKSLKDAFVISRDGKPFSLPIPHFNVPDFGPISELEQMIGEKLEAYEKKFGSMPKTVAVDSVSRISTDLENYYKATITDGFKAWDKIGKDIAQFNDSLNDLLGMGINVIIIAHIKWDEKLGKFVENSKGNFGQNGGFLSTVDYALNIEIVGKKRIVTHRNSNLGRTFLDDMPDKQAVEEFNLQDYINKIAAMGNEIADKWSI